VLPQRALTIPSQNFDLASKLAEIARISERAQAEVLEQTQAVERANVQEAGLGDDDDVIAAESNLVDAERDASADSELAADASPTDDRFSAAGIDLTHDLGDLVSDNTDGLADAEVHDESAVDMRHSESVDAVEEDASKVDVDLGGGAASSDVRGASEDLSVEQGSEDKASAEDSAKTRPSVNLIDIHLVDIGDAEELGESAASGVASTDSEHVSGAGSASEHVVSADSASEHVVLIRRVNMWSVLIRRVNMCRVLMRQVTTSRVLMQNNTQMSV